MDCKIEPWRRNHRPQQAVAAAGCQAPSFAALPRAHVFIRHLQSQLSMPSRSGERTSARVHAMSPEWWVAMGLLDSLATAIRFRLSSRAREGAWAGPDAMGVGVVFAGSIGPVNPLPTLILSGCRPVGPVRTRCWSVLSSQASCPHPRSRRGLPVCWTRSGRLACRRRVTHPWCAAWNLVGSGWPSAAMMPILSKSVGGDKPQYPVKKSTRFWRRRFAPCRQ